MSFHGLVVGLVLSLIVASVAEAVPNGTSEPDGPPPCVTGFSAFHEVIRVIDEYETIIRDPRVPASAYPTEESRFRRVLAGLKNKVPLRWLKLLWPGRPGS